MDLSAVAVPAVRLGGAVQLVTDVQAAGGGGVVRSQDVEASGDEELQRKERMAVVTTEGGGAATVALGLRFSLFKVAAYHTGRCVPCPSSMRVSHASSESEPHRFS